MKPAEFSAGSFATNLMVDDAIEGHGFLDPFLNFAFRRRAVYEILRLVNFGELRRKIVRSSLGEFRQGIHSGGLKKLCELRPHAVDSHQIRVIHEFQDLLFGDLGLLCDFFSPGLGRALSKQRLNRSNARVLQLSGENFANAFNF